MDLINEYVAKFDECLNLVDYGSPQKKRDIAFMMMSAMIKASVWRQESRTQILLDLAYHAVEKKEIITNLKNEVSSHTSLSIDYSAYEGVMVFLSSERHLNMDTVKYVFSKLEAEYKKYSGGSCMQDAVYNVPFYGFNCAVLSKCLDAAGIDYHRTGH